MHFAVENGRKAGESDGVDRALVDAQLARILSSREFIRSDRMARFLRHVVSCRLEGRTEHAKERVIGVEVFDRPEDWDPKIDTIVRTEARRLRSKLEQYYSSLNDDLVKFTLPKGVYYPEFEILQTRTLTPNSAALQGDTPARRKQPRVLWIAPAILAIAIFAWLFFHRPAAKEQTNAFEVVPFANEIGSELSPAISPDGKSVAYVWDGNTGNYDIYVKRADGGPDTRPRRITRSSAAELSPAWSPDGRAFAFLRVADGIASLVTIDLITGEERRLVVLRQSATGWAGENAPFVDLGPSWTPDGKSIVFSDFTESTDRHGQQTHALYRVNVASGAVTSILQGPRGVVNFFPRVAPDGRSLAFVRYVSHGVSDLYLCDIDGSHTRPVTSEKRAITGLAWAPNANALYFTSWHHGSSRIWRVNTNPGSQAELLPDAMSAAELAIAGSNEWIAYTSVIENWNIWRMPLNESGDSITLGVPRRFIASSGRNHGPSFSPDGKKLAFISDRSGAWQIWLADADGGDVHQISRSDGGFLGSINWSPDSKTIAFDARPMGNSNIFMLDVSSGGVPKPFAANHFEERMPSFSADGKSIYFNSNRDGVVAVWKAHLAGGSAQKIGLNASFKSLEAPSGKRLFFNIFETIYSSNLDGSNATRLPVGEVSPDINWVPTDRAFYFTEQTDDGQIAFLACRNGKTTLLRKMPGRLVQNTSNLAVSPDRHWLLYAQRDQATSDIMIRRRPKLALNR